MKLPRSLLFGTLLGLCTISTPASAQGTIVDIVSQSGGTFDTDYFDYDILLNAVITAELVDALADDTADLTVFAPNDLAFVRLARDLGYTGIDVLIPIDL